MKRDQDPQNCIYNKNTNYKGEHSTRGKKNIKLPHANGKQMLHHSTSQQNRQQRKHTKTCANSCWTRVGLSVKKLA